MDIWTNVCQYLALRLDKNSVKHSYSIVSLTFGITVSTTMTWGSGQVDPRQG